MRVVLGGFLGSPIAAIKVQRKPTILALKVFINFTPIWNHKIVTTSVCLPKHPVSTLNNEQVPRERTNQSSKITWWIQRAQHYALLKWS
jgi:hypothetical protein